MLSADNVIKHKSSVRNCNISSSLPLFLVMVSVHRFFVHPRTCLQMATFRFGAFVNLSLIAASSANTLLLGFKKAALKCMNNDVPVKNTTGLKQQIHKAHDEGMTH